MDFKKSLRLINLFLGVGPFGDVLGRFGAFWDVSGSFGTLRAVSGRPDHPEIISNRPKIVPKPG